MTILPLSPGLSHVVISQPRSQDLFPGLGVAIGSNRAE